VKIPREDTLHADDDFAAPATPEKRLWTAVLALAVLDARSAVASLRSDVAQWITTSDFERVCELADQPSDMVKRGIRRILDDAPKREPTEKQKAKSDRHQKILELRSKGHSLESIARQTGLSKAGVSKIIQYQPVVNSV
jgi:DNA-binding NarL/FixJ family response regulator